MITIIRDRDGRLWIDAPLGLFRFEPSGLRPPVSSLNPPASSPWDVRRPHHETCERASAEWLRHLDDLAARAAKGVPVAVGRLEG